MVQCALQQGQPGSEATICSSALQESDQSAARELISLIPKLNQKWLSDDSFIVKHLKWYHLIFSVLWMRKRSAPNSVWGFPLTFIVELTIWLFNSVFWAFVLPSFLLLFPQLKKQLGIHRRDWGANFWGFYEKKENNEGGIEPFHSWVISHSMTLLSLTCGIGINTTLQTFLFLLDIFIFFFTSFIEF